jgi:hypothetical protein
MQQLLHIVAARTNDREPSASNVAKRISVIVHPLCDRRIFSTSIRKAKECGHRWERV